MADFAPFELRVISPSALEPIELGKILFGDCEPSEHQEIIQNLFLKPQFSNFLNLHTSIFSVFGPLSLGYHSDMSR